MASTGVPSSSMRRTPPSSPSVASFVRPPSIGQVLMIRCRTPPQFGGQLLYDGSRSGGSSCRTALVPLPVVGVQPQVLGVLAGGHVPLVEHGSSRRLLG